MGLAVDPRTNMSLPRISRTALRIGGGIAVVLALFGAALWVTLAALDRLANAQAEVVLLDHAKHAGHLAAAQVREQYIHQAHTIINWDTSHLDHYESAVAETRKQTSELQRLARTREEMALAAQIAELAEENDGQFRGTILPNLEGVDHERMRDLHDRLDAQVQDVVRLNEELNRLLENRSREAQAYADDLRGRTRRLILSFFGLDLVLSAAVGFLILRSVLKPVSALREGALRVARGDLSGQIRLKGHDEFAELAATFNRMTADLARHQENLVRAQKLASIGQIAAGVAHEINNPLSVILGYAKVLQRSPEAPRDELRMIEEEARQCQSIVQALLELARPPRLETGEVDLAELATQEVERLQGAGKLDGLIVRPPLQGAVTAWVDERRLRQVLSNLLRNAAEATPSGGTISVEIRPEADEVTVTVSDSGPGIPPEALPRVFEPFFTTKATGTGLGLAVSQAIVSAHGGRIEVRSEPAGGARFIVHLPVQPMTAEKPA